MFTWTRELEAWCLPVRGQGTPLAGKPAPEKKLFAIAAQALAGGIAARPATTALIEHGGGDGSPAEEADLFIITGSLQAGAKLVDGIVDRWFERYGARGAIEIVTMVGAWAPPGFPVSMLLDPVLPRVRAHLAHAADYEAARAFLTTLPAPVALPAYRTTNPYDRSREMIAFLFPDQRSFFAEAAAHATECNRTATYLLAAVQSPAELAALGGGIAYQSWDKHGVTLTYALREAALEPLVAYTQRSQAVVGVARALTAFVSETAAAALAQYVETKPALPLLEAYFQTHRELARKVLEPLATSKKKKVRETAMRLLG